MKKKQEKTCIDNIQSYVDRIEWLLNGNSKLNRPQKVCNLCRSFGPLSQVSYVTKKNCAVCPLGPGSRNCMRQEHYLPTFCHTEIHQLKTRMHWLLKKYKKAGLEIEIVEE